MRKPSFEKTETTVSCSADVRARRGESACRTHGIGWNKMDLTRCASREGRRSCDSQRVEVPDAKHRAESCNHKSVSTMFLRDMLSVLNRITKSKLCPDLFIKTSIILYSSTG